MLPRRAWPSQPLISDAFDALRKALGPELPASALARADEVIE
jgi:hypothetical protein